MNIEVSRRHFMKMAGTGVAGSAIGAFGFGDAEAMVAAHVRPFKLAKATETRNTCTYCSVACGIIMYSRGDVKKGEKAEIYPHRGRLRSSNQSRHAVPEGRGAARLREVRDAHEISSSPRAGQQGVEADLLGRGARPHRPPDEGRPRPELHRHQQGRRARSTAGRRTGFLAASATTNETAFADLQGGQKRRHGRVRQPGACLTRPDGGQFGPDVRPWCDDELLDRHQEYRPRRDHGRQCRRGASVRLQVGDRGEGQPRREADRRRSALHALGLGCGSVRADPAGHAISPSCSA